MIRFDTAVEYSLKDKEPDLFESPVAWINPCISLTEPQVALERPAEIFKCFSKFSLLCLFLSIRWRDGSEEGDEGEGNKRGGKKTKTVSAHSGT